MLGGEDVEKWVVGRGHAGSDFIKCVMKVSKRKKKSKGQRVTVFSFWFHFLPVAALPSGVGQGSSASALSRF